MSSAMSSHAPIKSAGFFGPLSHYRTRPSSSVVLSLSMSTLLHEGLEHSRSSEMPGEVDHATVFFAYDILAYSTFQINLLSLVSEKDLPPPSVSLPAFLNVHYSLTLDYCNLAKDIANQNRTNIALNDILTSLYLNEQIYEIMISAPNSGILLAACRKQVIAGWEAASKAAASVIASAPAAKSNSTHAAATPALALFTRNMQAYIDLQLTLWQFVAVDGMVPLARFTEIYRPLTGDYVNAVQFAYEESPAPLSILANVAADLLRIQTSYYALSDLSSPSLLNMVRPEVVEVWGDARNQLREILAD